MARHHPAVPADVLLRLRGICGALAEAREEQAWTGIRWRIGRKTFAHVVMIDAGWPPAYARAAGADGPLCVLTFRSWLAEGDPDAFTDAPFFRPRWFADIAGMAMDARTDWAEVMALVAASYRLLAPRRLADAVALPPDPFADA